MRKINNIIIHHSATSPSASFDAIKKYHIEHNGWKDIGYHYVIDGKGTVHKGRKDETIGAHAKGKNKDTLGICVLGNYENIMVEKHVLDTLILLLNRLLETYKLSPDNVLGHRDVNPTLCPGKNLYGLLPYVRSQLPSRSGV